MFFSLTIKQVGPIGAALNDVLGRFFVSGILHSPLFHCRSSGHTILERDGGEHCPRMARTVLTRISVNSALRRKINMEREAGRHSERVCLLVSLCPINLESVSLRWILHRINGSANKINYKAKVNAI